MDGSPPRSLFVFESQPNRKNTTMKHMTRFAALAALILSLLGATPVVAQGQPPISYGNITNLRASMTPNTTVFLNWEIDNIVEFSTGGFKVTAWDFTRGEETDHCLELLPPVVGLVGTQCDLVGLHSNTTYRFTVESYSGGTGGVKAVTTQFTTPPLPPRAVNPRHTPSQRSLLIEWDHVGHQEPILYGVWLSEPGLATCGGNAGTRASTLSCVIGGLEPLTQYEVHIYSEDQYGQRSGDVVYFATTMPETSRPNPTTTTTTTTTSTTTTTTLAPTPPNDPDPRCLTDGRFYRVVMNKIDKAWVKWTIKEEAIRNRLDGKPKRMAKAIARQDRIRDKKIKRALATYERRCPDFV